MNLKTIEKWLTTWWGMWLVFFIYTAVLAAFVQLIVLPDFLPRMHYGHGLFVPDSTGFDQVARSQAAVMMKDGWKAWRLFPKGHYPAGVASIFYYLWYPEPFSLIPFNAALHAASGCLVFFLLYSFIPNRVAAFGGAALFVMNPASLEWTSQIHRDGTFILGNLLVLSAWLLMLKNIKTAKWRYLAYSAVTFLAGASMIWVSRDYWIQVVLVACVIVTAGMLLSMIRARSQSASINIHHIAPVLLGCIMLAMLMTFMRFTKTYSFSEGFETGETNRITWQTADGIVLKMGFKARVAVKDPDSGKVMVIDFTKPDPTPKNSILGVVFIEGPFKNLFLPDRIVWRTSPVMPNFIEAKLNGLSMARLGATTTGGKSVIDPEVQFMSAKEYLSYLPRAFQVGFLSPFPSMCFTRGNTAGTTAGKTVLGIVTMFFYVCIVFFVWSLLIYVKDHNFLLVALFSTYGLLVFTYVYPNIGTLLRLRYCFFMTIVSIGFAFMIQQLINKRNENKTTEAQRH